MADRHRFPILSSRWERIRLFVFRQQRPLHQQIPASKFLRPSRSVASSVSRFRSLCLVHNGHIKPVTPSSKKPQWRRASSTPEPLGSTPPESERPDSRAAARRHPQLGEPSNSMYPPTSIPRRPTSSHRLSSATGSRAVVKLRGPGARSQQRLWVRRFSDTTIRPPRSRRRYSGTCRFTDLSQQKVKPTLAFCAGSDRRVPKPCPWSGKRNQTPRACRSPRDCPSPGA